MSKAESVAISHIDDEQREKGLPSTPATAVLQLQLKIRVSGAKAEDAILDTFHGKEFTSALGSKLHAAKSEAANPFHAPTAGSDYGGPSQFTHPSHHPMGAAEAGAGAGPGAGAEVGIGAGSSEDRRGEGEGSEGWSIVHYILLFFAALAAAMAVSA